MKLTPWFPADIKPVRKGVYQLGLEFFQPWFVYWDGSQWAMGEDNIKEAAMHRYGMPGNWTWRGLAVNPKSGELPKRKGAA